MVFIGSNIYSLLVSQKKIFILFLLSQLLFPKLVIARNIYTGIYGMVGIYSNNEYIDIASANGFQIIQTNSDKTVLDEAQKRSLKCLVSFWLTKEIADDEEKWRKWLNYVQTKIGQLKNHPAVFAWYLVDEPDGQGISIQKIKESHNAVKTIDKLHPMFTVFNEPKKWSSYLEYFDIVSVDPYMTYYNKDSAKTDVVRYYLSHLKKDLILLKLNKPVWVVLGAFKMEHKSKTHKGIYKIPTPNEFNQMVDISLSEGVSGILVYSLAAFNNNSEYREWNLPIDDPLLWDTVKHLPGRVR